MPLMSLNKKIMEKNCSIVDLKWNSFLHLIISFQLQDETTQ